MKYSRQSLKETIRLLEIRQEEEKELLNLQFKATFNSLKPSNLIKSTLRDISHNTLELKNNLLEAFLPLITNFISGRIVGKGKKYSFFNLIAAMLQMTLTSYAAKHSHAIIAYFNDLIDYLKGFLRKEEHDCEEQEEAPNESEMKENEGTGDDPASSEEEEHKQAE